MKFKKILEKISTFTDSPLGSILTKVVPGLGVVDSVVSTANSILGPDAVNEQTTVKELAQKIEALSSEDQARMMEAECQVEIVKTKAYAEVAIAQEQNKSSTRPEIAKQMANVFVGFAFTSLLFLVIAMSLDAWLVFEGNKAFLFKIAMEGMPWLAAAYAIPAMGIVERYFARRSQDKQTATSLALAEIGKPEEEDEDEGPLTKLLSRMKGDK